MSAGDRYAYKDFITLTDEEVEKIIRQRTSSGRLLGEDQCMGSCLIEEWEAR